uniref:Exostosin domain-containing protein n=1 Tax=Macrostomum lignano TaxID=282301 RepID=A0A1I8FE09_9PLAT
LSSFPSFKTWQADDRRLTLSTASCSETPSDGFSYAALNAGLPAPRGGGQPVGLLSLGMGRYYRQAEQLHLDVGAFARALEVSHPVRRPRLSASRRAAFFGGRSQNARLDGAAAVVMVGDDIVSDVGAERWLLDCWACRCGLESQLGPFGQQLLQLVSVGRTDSLRHARRAGRRVKLFAKLRHLLVEGVQPGCQPAGPPWRGQQCQARTRCSSTRSFRVFIAQASVGRLLLHSMMEGSQESPLIGVASACRFTWSNQRQPSRAAPDGPPPELAAECATPIATVADHSRAAPTRCGDIRYESLQFARFHRVLKARLAMALLRSGRDLRFNNVFAATTNWHNHRIVLLSNPETLGFQSVHNAVGEHRTGANAENSPQLSAMRPSSPMTVIKARLLRMPHSKSLAS